MCYDYSSKDINILFIYKMCTAKGCKYNCTESDKGVEFLSYSEDTSNSKITLAIYFQILVSSYLDSWAWRKRGKGNKELLS